LNGIFRRRPTRRLQPKWIGTLEAAAPATSLVYQVRSGAMLRRVDVRPQRRLSWLGTARVSSLIYSAVSIPIARPEPRPQRRTLWVGTARASSIIYQRPVCVATRPIPVRRRRLQWVGTAAPAVAASLVFYPSKHLVPIHRSVPPRRLIWIGTVAPAAAQSLVFYPIHHRVSRRRPTLRYQLWIGTVIPPVVVVQDARTADERDFVLVAAVRDFVLSADDRDFALIVRAP